MGTSVTRLLTGCSLILILTILAIGGAAQVGGDPRNSSDEYLDAVNNAQCYAHHGGEGFYPFDFGFTDHYSQLPINEPTTIEVRVRYPHRGMDPGPELVEEIAVLLNTTEAPNVRVITDDLPDDLDTTLSFTVSSGSPFSDRVRIFDGAYTGYVSARLVSWEPWPVPPGEAPDAGALDVQFGGHALTGTGAFKSLQIDRDMIVSTGPGNWSLEGSWRSPFSVGNAQTPVPQSATVEVRVMMNYTAEGTEFIFPAPGSALVRPATGGDLALIPVTVVITSEEPALLDFRVQGVSFWPHQPGDGAPLDEGLFYRFMTMRVTGGEEAVIGGGAVAPLPAQAVDLYNLFTRLLGMIALFLVLTTMVTGGVFGRGSRRWLNKFTGGAKKRVLWHSSAGFLIIVVATLHFAVALLDSLNTINVGLFWGGVAWFLLITLGFTGYYQVRMIKRWNYRVWRHVHLWSAVGVIVFALMHTLLDGSDLSALRELLPGGYERLLWPSPP